LNPQIGYFIANGLAVGISPIYAYSNARETYSAQDSSTSYVSSSITKSDTKTNSIGAGVFIKYYSKLGFFLNMQIQYLYNKSVYSSEYLNFSPGTTNILNRNQANTYSHSNTYAISPGLGYAIFLNSNISLEPMISYSFNKNIESENGTTNFIQISSGIQGKENYSSSQTSKQGGLYFTLELNIFLK